MPAKASATPYNRGHFLAATVQAVGGATLPGLTSAAQAATDKPPTGAEGFTVIDTHPHFYDPSRSQGVPWPPRDDKLPIAPCCPRIIVPNWCHGLTGTVVVEASPWVEDNQWVLDLAAHDPFIVGFVGSLPVGTTEFAGHLKRFAANRTFRGIRLGSRKLGGTADDYGFFGDLKLMVDHDLSLDFLGGTEILPFADRLAKEVPSLRIIIDHHAGLVIDGKAPLADWLKHQPDYACYR